MTDLRPDDWDDDRLSAAFTARSAMTPPTPSDLAEEVRAGVGRPGRRLATRWPRLAGVAAVAMLVAVVAGTGLIGRLKPTPSASPAPPAAQVSADPQDPVLEALGDPISVTEALAVRDAESSREIAVKGFLSPLPIMFCALEIGPLNPTHPRCSATRQWVMEQPEQLWGPSATGTHEPKGPAFHPSFALVEPPDVPMPETDDQLPVPVVLIGHFNDRRARICAVNNRERCTQTFIVDRVASVDGAILGASTWGKTAEPPHDPESFVDGLVATAAPKSVLLSRQLLPLDQAVGVEPLLANDQLIPQVDQTSLAWLATTVDLAEGVPVARTFMLLDGSHWFAEITAGVVRQLELTAPQPSGTPATPGPTAEPDAFVSAPFSVLGIKVESVVDVNRERVDPDFTHYRDEYAIRGWYIAPKPGISCDPAIAEMHPPNPPCDEARHWLLHDPQEYGLSLGQPRVDPVAPPWVLNPLLPVDVPFDVGETWRGDVPVPQPVIALGHFADNRITPARGSDKYFTIDALAWSRNDVAAGWVNRLTNAATEDPSAVAARVSAISPEQPLATWITAVDAATFAQIEANGGAARDAMELTEGGPVWIVRRLIVEEDERAPRFAVESLFTADQGTRVWWARNPDSDARLATSLDLHDMDGNTQLISLYDYDSEVTAIRSANGLGGLSWQPVDGMPRFVDIARGEAPNIVVIRWRGPQCESTWDVDAHVREASVSLDVYPRGECESGEVMRRLVIEFDHPVDIDKFNSGFCCG